MTWKIQVKLILTLSFLLIVSLTSAQNLKTLKIKGAVTEPSNRYYTWFKDCSGLLSINAVFDSLNTGKFQSVEGAKAFNQGFTKCTYWMAISIQNDTTINLPVLWSFYNNSIEFTLYDATKPVSIVLIDSSSTNQVLSKRNYPVRSVSFKIDLKPNEKRLLMIKIHTNNTDNLYFPTDITTIEDYLLYEVDYSFLIGRYIGYFLFAFIFNLMLWIALKERIYVWHAAYVLSLIAFDLNDFMVDSYIFPDWFYHYWSFLPKVAFLIIPVFLSMNVFQIFINQKKDFSNLYFIFKIYKRITLLVIILMVISGFVFSFHHPVNFILRLTSNYLSFIGIGFIFINIVIGLIRKHYYTILYSISATFLLFALIDFSLVTLKMAHLFFIKPGNVTVAFTFEIVVLTIIFVYKYREEKNQSIEALAQTVLLKDNWVKEIIKVQESERQRIARDLHDDVGATLSTLKLHLSNKADIISYKDEKHYHQSINLIDKANNDIRSISHDLLPIDFMQVGLFKSLSNRLLELNKSKKTIFRLITEGDEAWFDGNNFAIIIYRIINELISNIIKHAQASEANIQIAMLENKIQIIVDDNGIGMQHVNNKGGIGLNNITTRVEYLKGDIYFDTNDNGTTVIINIPISNN